MKSWTKFSGAVTIGLALTLGSAARAQPTDGPPPPRDQPDRHDGRHDEPRGDEGKKDRSEGREGRGGMVRQIGQIVRELNLDESQRRAMRDIFEESREDAQRIHEDFQDAGARQAELQKLAEKVRKDVERELTDEQLTTFRQKMDELSKQTPDRQNGSRFPKIDRLSDALMSLNLTEEQRPQIDHLLGDLRKRAEEIRADAPNKDPEESKDNVKKLMRETHRELREILTPQQADELRERLRPPPDEQGDDRKGDRREDRGDDKREKRDRDESRDDDRPRDGPPPEGRND